MPASYWAPTTDSTTSIEPSSAWTFAQVTLTISRSWHMIMSGWTRLPKKGGQGPTRKQHGLCWYVHAAQQDMLYVCMYVQGYLAPGKLAYLQAKQAYSAPLQDATGREQSKVRERFDYPEGLKDPPCYLLLSRKVYEKMDAIFPDGAVGKRRKHRSHTGAMRITAST